MARKTIESLEKEIEALRVDELCLVTILLRQGDIDQYSKLLGEVIALRPWAKKFLFGGTFSGKLHAVEKGK